MTTDISKSILLVEDDPIIALAESKALSNFGYHVLPAYSGESAIGLVESGQAVDLVLMDIDLGHGLDGPQTAREILRHHNLPIVFLTSHAEKTVVERVKGITRYGYVIKNTGDYVLQSSIEMALELFEAHQTALRNEEEITRLLKEKEFLLREVHHRIKNNMSSISGLLQLQAQTLSNREAVAALQDASSRVQSMMIVYDRLYRSDDFKRINIQEFLTALLDDIARTIGTNELQINLLKELDDFTVDSELAIPLGIIVNEWISNAIKYAFPVREEGNIRVTLRRLGLDHFALDVSDDGIGLPDQVNIEQPESFGLGLVQLLVKQLGGKLELTRAGGTCYNLIVPIREARR